MEILISKKLLLEEIPSASGVEVFGEAIYIIGDDSSWLFRLDQNYKIKERVPLLPKQELSDRAIAKAHKPDFEAMTFARIRNEKTLLIFGSGSKPMMRDALVMVFPESGHRVESFNLSKLYGSLRKDHIAEGRELNIEAATADENCLYLFHRGNILGNNLMFSFALKEFCDYVFGLQEEIPICEARSFELPKVAGIVSGFSGASMLDQTRIVFSSSVEDTKNEIDDGAVLGSFIGILDLKTGQIESRLLQEKDSPLLSKVESVALGKVSRGIYSLLAVTDSDGGHSELLEIELKE